MEAKSDRAAWIKGGNARCNVSPARPDKPWRLVLLGAPGVGKGTQAELISERLGACHLSTGDVFRAARNLDEKDRSPALNEALQCMQQGRLVSDQLVLGMVRERVACLRCHGGFLLDGFPRTVAQAQALEALLTSQDRELDAVLSYELPIDQIVNRLSGRRTCSNCKAVYHLETRPPKTDGLCDHCGASLFQRDDDRPESIKVRMAAYEQSTAPLAEFYRSRGLLVSIEADGTPEEIFNRTLERLEAPA